MQAATRITPLFGEMETLPARRHPDDDDDYRGAAKSYTHP
jgi:hypothetical protein